MFDPVVGTGERPPVVFVGAIVTCVTTPGVRVVVEVTWAREGYKKRFVVCQKKIVERISTRRIVEIVSALFDIKL